MCGKDTRRHKDAGLVFIVAARRVACTTGLQISQTVTRKDGYKKLE